MGTQKKDCFYYIKLSCFVVFLLTLVGIVVVADLHTIHLPVFRGTSWYVEQNWKFGEKGETPAAVRLEDQHLFEPGKTYVLSTELTYSGQGDDYPSVLMTFGNYEAWVYLDGEKVFEYSKENRGWPRLKGMGSATVSIPLGNHCQGTEFRMELRTPMDYASVRRMPEIRMGDYSTQIHELYLQNIPNITISMAIAFVVIVLLLLGASSVGDRWAYFHFSVFAVLIVAYRSMQNLYLLYTWGNPVVSIMLEFFSIAACPIPMLLAFYYALGKRYQKTFRMLIAISCVNFLVQLVCHLTGIMDVVEFLTITHGWILLSGSALVLTVFKTEREDSSVHCIRKLLPILTGAVLDFLVFYIRWQFIGAGSFFVVGNYIGLGLLTSLCVMVWEVRKEREAAFVEYERNKLLERVAYEDALTHVENRAAYSRELSAIDGGVYGHLRILVVSADLNDLKKVNDSQGHTAGDELICRAAWLLRDCFGEYGHVFRTGGDEFSAILYGLSDSQWNHLQRKFQEELDARNRNQKIPLSLAVGHAFMDSTMEECIQLADKRMYINKDIMKGTSQYGFSVM